MQHDLTDLHHSKATEHLIRFWLNLPRAEGQVCPKRSDFSSAQINGALPEVFVSEWQERDALVIVQAGTILDRLIGMDMTGRNIFDITPRTLVEDEQRYYKALRDQPCAGMITRNMVDFLNHSFVYRTLQLPLLDPFGKVRYFVGTGYSLSPAQMQAEFGRTCFKDTSLVDRRFYDIGADVPGGTRSGEPAPPLSPGA
ncbi:MAG: PAS domain-containing protein [Alphaproteobacteria bacterium]|nr:MAG: PAS domain-containing protein [Alphaproteobacteria bacterium]